MKAGGLLLTRLVKPERPYVQHRMACPEQPLTLLEMDIKMIWVEEYRRYAYVLTILDTFKRLALYWHAGYRMKWEDVRRAWEWVIVHHLQPAQALAKGLHIEVRSDNGPQFLAQRLREFFMDNHLSQVFTHPYTPQENGHVESFHSILATAMRHEHSCLPSGRFGRYNNWTPVWPYSTTSTITSGYTQRSLTCRPASFSRHGTRG